MTPVLIVLVAHGLDALTLLMALERYPFEGNEYGFGAQLAFAAAGVGGVLVMKTAGGLLAGAIVLSRRLWSPDGQRHLGTPVLLFAAAAGIVGAAVNLTALAL